MKVIVKKGKEDIILLIGDKYRNISDYLDEVALDVLKLSRDANNIDDIKIQIERVREIMNNLINVNTSLYKNETIIRVSKILDELLNLYYKR